MSATRFHTHRTAVAGAVPCSSSPRCSRPRSSSSPPSCPAPAAPRRSRLCEPHIYTSARPLGLHRMYKPKFDLRKYRADVPADDTPAGADEPLDFATLEPYVPESKPQQPLPLHTRLPRRLGLLTAEPPKPAVVYRDQQTQTEPVRFASEPAAEDPYTYVAYNRSDAAELRSENIRLQREVDDLRLAAETLSIEQDTEAAELRSENIRLQREVDALRFAAETMSIEQHNSRAAEQRSWLRKRDSSSSASATTRAARSSNRRPKRSARRPSSPSSPSSPSAPPSPPRTPAPRTVCPENRQVVHSAFYTEFIKRFCLHSLNVFTLCTERPTFAPTVYTSLLVR
jgi:hypothetical protein